MGNSINGKKEKLKIKIIFPEVLLMPLLDSTLTIIVFPFFLHIQFFLYICEWGRCNSIQV